MSIPTLEEKINNLQHKYLRPSNFPPTRPSNDSHGGGRFPRPNRLPSSGAPRRPVNLPVPQPMPQKSSQEDESRWQEIIKRSGLLKINGQEYRTQVSDLEHLGELGNGTCGHVVKMLHRPSSAVIAVKQMRRSGNVDENKRITMDIEVVLKSDDCPYIVQCVGCFILEADVWICMELMDTCFDKLLKRLKKPIPEHILGKVTVATVKALNYLKETHDVMHRDVKPSNILLDKRGNVKLCDFGISGRLVDSKAQTRSAGCAAYMAPERIDPPDPRHPTYDIRADVWSLGITLVELATGVFPYSNCLTDFEVLTKVLTTEPPRLPPDQNFSDEFRDFVNCCLTKDYKVRPKFRQLLIHPFIAKYSAANVNVAEWYASESEPELLPKESNAAQRSSNPIPSQVSDSTVANTSTANSTALSSPSPMSSTMRRFSGTSSISTATSSIRCNPTSLYPSHVRSVSETGRTFLPAPQHHHALPHAGHQSHYFNGDATTSPSNTRRNNTLVDASSGGRFSPFHSSRMAGAVEPVGVEVNHLRATPPPMSPAHAFWQAQEARAAEWDAHRLNYSSPGSGRKRFPSEPPQPSYKDSCVTTNTSPLVLQRFYHQHQQQQQQQQQNMNHVLHHYHYYNHVPHGSYSQNEPLSEPIESLKGEETNNLGKKRFTSILKFNLGSSNNSVNSTSSSPGRMAPPRPSRHASPGPPPSSPDPPPRLSRMGSSDGSTTSSPLAARRNFLDVSPVRRGVLDGSPSLPRRYVSPSPPQPPPRRLSTEGVSTSFNGTSSFMNTGSSNGTSSTPGSPQVRRLDSIRARFHYTPQPQRRMFGTTSDFHDL